MILIGKEFKQFIKDLEAKIDILLAEKHLPFEDSLVALNRHQLGSIDLSDLPKLTEEEQKAQDAQIAAAFPVLEQQARALIKTQLEFIGQEALTWEQTLVGRGTVNGLYLQLELWRDAKNRHDALNPPPDPFDPHNPLPEINQ